MFTATELKIFNFLVEGKTFRQIAGILQKSSASINTFCTYIRRKTNIKDLSDPKECRHWLRNNQISARQKERGPTAKQRDVLWMLSQGMSLQEIANLRGVGKQCIESQAYSGRRRAGIKDTLRETLVEWFKQQEIEHKAMEERVQKRFFPEKFFLNGDPCF